MPPDSEDEKLRKLLARHGLPPVIRYMGAFFVATSSVTVAGVTGAAVRQPATSTLVWMFAMLVLHGLILYWLLDRCLRHLERLAELSADSDLLEHWERCQCRSKKRRPKGGRGSAG